MAHAFCGGRVLMGCVCSRKLVGLTRVSVPRPSQLPLSEFITFSIELYRQQCILTLCTDQLPAQPVFGFLFIFYVMFGAFCANQLILAIKRCSPTSLKLSTPPNPVTLFNRPSISERCTPGALSLQHHIISTPSKADSTSTSVRNTLN